MYSAARLVFSLSRYGSVSPLLRQLHWLRAPGRIQYKLAVLTFRCLYGTAPPHLADEFLLSSDFEARVRLRSASSSSLIVRRARLSTFCDRAFPVAAARVWYDLARHVTYAPSLRVFCSRLKTQLFSRSFPDFL